MITDTKFEIKDFEHGPVLFLALTRTPPVIAPKHQIIRGIECRQALENINFILIPDWMQKDNVFVLRYVESEEALMLEIETEPQPNVTHSGAANPQGASSSKEVPTAMSEEVSEKAVILLCHVQGVSFLVNKQNGINVALHPTVPTSKD